MSILYGVNKTTLEAYLKAERRKVWEEAAKYFEVAFERSYVVQDVLDYCKAQAVKETP